MSSSDTEARKRTEIAELVLAGYSRGEAAELALRLEIKRADAEAAKQAPAAPDPAADAALAAANAAAPEADSDVARFLNMTAVQMAALSEEEYRRLWAAAKATGFRR